MREAAHDRAGTTGPNDATSAGPRARELAQQVGGTAEFFPLLYGDAGHLDDGLEALDRAIAVMDQTGERVWEADLYRLRGEFLRRQGASDDEVEVWLERALRVACQQEAKSLELRAATSLARLWAAQGKNAEASGLLAPVYGWFTEGFDTADLKEARALLEE